MRPVDTATKLRFPILFGGILGIFFTGFIYRQKFMSDIAEKREGLHKENLEGKKLLQTKINESHKSIFEKMKT